MESALACLTCMALTGAELPRTDVSREQDYGVSCLALVGFTESRGESEAGEATVQLTVLNRIRDRRWTETICSVAQSPEYHGVRDMPYPRAPWLIDADAWARSKRIAVALLDRDLSLVPPACRGATSFSTSDRAGMVCRVGSHTFTAE